MLVDTEMLGGPDSDIVVYTHSIRQWQPPHDGESLSDDQRARIMENIDKALRNLRIEWGGELR